MCRGDGRPPGLEAHTGGEEETTPGHVTGLSIFWSILDCSRVSAQPEKNDQAAVSKRLFDGAPHARGAGDL